MGAAKWDGSFASLRKIMAEKEANGEKKGKVKSDKTKMETPKEKNNQE